MRPIAWRQLAFRDDHPRFELSIAATPRCLHRCVVVRKRGIEVATPIATQSDRSLDRCDSCRIVRGARIDERAAPERQRRRVVAETLAYACQVGDHLARNVHVTGFGDRERCRQVVRRFAVGVLRRRVATGGAKVLHRLSREPPRIAARVVERQLAGMTHRMIAVELLERLGDRAMQRSRSRQTQLRVQRFLKQWMRKVIHDVGGVLTLAEHVCAAQLVDRRDQCVVIETADRRQLIVRGARAQRRRNVGQAA